MNKRLLALLTILLSIALITGCSSNNNSDVIKIKKVKLKFDQKQNFHDIEYKILSGIKKSENQQAIYLDYKNNKLYKGNFVFRVSISFIKDTTIDTYIKNKKATSKMINGVNWKLLTQNNRVNNKKTKSIVYTTEKNNNVYIVSVMSFNEANIDIKKISEVFIKEVKIKD